MEPLRVDAKFYTYEQLLGDEYEDFIEKLEEEMEDLEMLVM